MTSQYVRIVNIRVDSVDEDQVVLTYYHWGKGYEAIVLRSQMPFKYIPLVNDSSLCLRRRYALRFEFELESI